MRGSGRASDRRTKARDGAWYALTGTPGTGKSSVARKLLRYRPVEVGRLALDTGAGRRRGRSVEIDLPRLSQLLRRRVVPTDRLVVGHLAHLLPVAGVIVLRAHPLELARRLGRARRGSANDRAENVASEALDQVLIEARHRSAPVWEVDTTGRSVSRVARAVERLLVRRPPPRAGTVQWLNDPRVTAVLLGAGRSPPRWSRSGSGPASSRTSRG